MPAFDISVSIGTGLQPWVDPAGSSAPSRLNDNPLHIAGHWEATAPFTFVVAGVVGGVAGPADGNPVLNGMVFDAVLSEYSGPIPPQVTWEAGHKSVAQISFLPMHAGHHVLLVTFGPGGGAIQVPVDVL